MGLSLVWLIVVLVPDIVCSLPEDRSWHIFGVIVLPPDPFAIPGGLCVLLSVLSPRLATFGDSEAVIVRVLAVLVCRLAGRHLDGELWMSGCRQFFVLHGGEPALHQSPRGLLLLPSYLQALLVCGICLHSVTRLLT